MVRSRANATTHMVRDRANATNMNNTADNRAARKRHQNSGNFVSNNTRMGIMMRNNNRSNNVKFATKLYNKYLENGSKSFVSNNTRSSLMMGNRSNNIKIAKRLHNKMLENTRKINKHNLQVVKKINNSNNSAMRKIEHEIVRGVENQAGQARHHRGIENQAHQAPRHHGGSRIKMIKNMLFSKK